MRGKLLEALKELKSAEGKRTAAINVLLQSGIYRGGALAQKIEQEFYKQNSSQTSLNLKLSHWESIYSLVSCYWSEVVCVLSDLVHMTNLSHSTQRRCIHKLQVLGFLTIIKDNNDMRRSILQINGAFVDVLDDYINEMVSSYGAILLLYANPSISTTLADLKVAKTQLDQVEEKYFSAVGFGSNLITFSAVDGKRVFVNRAFCSFYGKHERDFLNKPPYYEDGKKLGETISAKIKTLSLTNPTLKYELEAKRCDGEVRWIEWQETALFDHSKQQVGIYSIGIDITEKKYREIERSQILKILEEVCNIAKVGYWVWDDLNNTYLEYSDGVAAIFEQSPNDMVGGNFADEDSQYIHDEDLPNYLSDITHAMKARINYDIEYRYHTPQKGIGYFREIGVPIYDDNGTLIRTIGITKDTSEINTLKAKLDKISSISNLNEK